MNEEINIQLINENVSTYLSSLQVNNPDFSINELRKMLTKMIGQTPAISVKRKESPLNEIIKNSGAKYHTQKDKIEELSIFYVDLENNKPVKITMLF